MFGTDQAQDDFHGEDLPDPKDVATAQKAQADPAMRASDMLHANPQLVHDPIGAHAMLSAPPDAGADLGQASKFINLYGATVKHANDAVNSENVAAHGVYGAGEGVGPDQPHAVRGGSRGNEIEADNPLNPNSATSHDDSYLGDLKAAWGSTKALGEGALHGVERAGKVVTELGSFGQVKATGNNPLDWKTSNNPADTYTQALHQAGSFANNTVNPLQVWKNMAHTAAFFESLVKRKGFAYAISTMAPYIAAGLITHSVLVGAGASDIEASNVIASDEASATEEAGLSKGLESASEQPVETAGEHPTPVVALENDDASPAPGVRDDTPTPVRSAVFRGASAVANVVSKPLAVVSRVVKPILAPSADVRLNAMYYAADAGNRANPETAKLWQDTANGMVMNPDGTQESVGNGLTQIMGLGTGGLSDFISDPTTFYAKWIGSDPYVAVGHVIGMTRTFAGTGGVLSKFFGGLSIRDAQDVYRVGRQYNRVSRAFQWMADHSAGQIEDSFRGLFFGIAGKEVLTKLGAATSKDEVMNIFGQMAEGQGYFHNVAPSMSGYALMKASFKYGGAEHVVDDSLGLGYDELRSEAASIEDQTGLKVLPPDSANYALAQGVAGARVRERTLMADLWQKMFTRRQMYFNEETSKMDDFDIHPTSVGVSHAVGDQLRALGASPTTVSVVEDALLHATEDDFNDLTKNIYKQQMIRRFYAVAKYSVLDEVKVQMEKEISDTVDRLMGADGAGEKGVMVNGPGGVQYSTAETGGKNMAIGETHLGRLHFARTRDLKDAADAMAKLSDEFSHAQDGMLGLDAHLSVNSLEVKAAFANSTLKGIAERLVDKTGSFPNDVSGLSSPAYAQKIQELTQATREALHGIEPDDMLGHNRAFVQMYDRVRQNLDEAQRTLSVVDDFRLKTNIVGKQTAYYQQVLDEANGKLPLGGSVESITPEQVSSLRGEVEALKDTEAEFSARLQKNAIGIDEIKEHISARQPKWSDAKVQQLAQKIQHEREINPRYRSIYEKFIDGTNYATSKVFVPLSLFSGGWAIRVGNSEMLLNTFRAGGMKMFNDKLMTSYVKNELGKAAFTSRLEGASGQMLTRLHLNNDDIMRGSFGEMTKRTDLNFAQKMESATLRSVGGLILGMRDAVGGTLHGIEGNLIHWDARTERMFDRVMGAVQDYAPGGLPGGVHSGGGIVSDEAMREHLLYGQEDGGKQAVSSVNENRTFASVDPENKNYYRGLRGALTRISDDQFLAPSMKELYNLVGSKDLSQTFSQAEINDLQDKMTQRALQTIDSKPDSLLERFDRNVTKGKMALSDDAVLAKLDPEERMRVQSLDPEAQQKYFAHYDWAATIARHDLYTVMGTVGDGRYLIHEPLLQQAATGEVQSIKNIRSYIDSLPNKVEPHGIVAETLADPGRNHWLKQMMNAPQNIYDAGFRSVLGPMVNAYVRDPLYLSLFDDEMEKLQSLADRNLIDEDSQKLRAHNNAMVKMSKFVHNPIDKELIESNTRAFAPFWFAQNQAWRRWLRVAEENPGSAYKYLRMSLGVTNFVSVMGQNLASEVHIPGTEWIGNIGDFAGKSLGPLGFSLSGSPSSISSVIPTGAEAGTGVLENIARPSWGPLVTVPLKEVQYHLGLVHIPYAQKVVKGILGPVAENSSLFDEVAPSSFGRNLFNLAEGQLNLTNSSFGSAQIWTFNNAVDNKSAELYAKNKSLVEQAGLTGTEAQNVTRALTDRQLASFFDVRTNHRDLQSFMDQVHTATVAMYAVKSVLGFGSPLSLSLQSNFSKEPQFQKILNEKNPDGSSKYTYEQAFTEFATKYPNNIYDLVSHTKAVGSSYPETLSAVSLLENNPYTVKTYPIASAYVVKRDEGYDPAAYQLELSNELRQRYPGNPEGLSQYMDALLIANGNDYYYNWLQPRYPEATGSQGYTNYEELTKQATNFGTFINPTWGAYKGSGDGGTYAVEATAVSQMTSMLKDQNVPNSVFGGSDNKELFNSLITKYNETVAAYYSASTSKDAYAIEQNWYAEMTKLSTAKYSDGDLMFPEQAYFMTSVLRYLPKKA